MCFFLGVWPEGSDGTDINALIRSHNRKVIALADDFCKVHLFAYPCSKPKVRLSCSVLWVFSPLRPSLSCVTSRMSSWKKFQYWRTQTDTNFFVCEFDGGAVWTVPF